MRTLHTILFLFLTAACFAQRVLPVALTNNNATYLSTYDRAVAEGMPIYGIYGTLGGAMTAGTGSGSNPQPGTSWYVDNFIVSSNDSAGVVVQFTNLSITPVAVIPPYLPLEFSKSGGSFSVPINRLMPGLTGVYVTMKRAITSTTYKMTYSVSGIRVSADFLKPADRIILKLGDSISEGSGITNAEEEYDFQVRDSLQKYTSKGWRIISKAKGSFTSSNLEGLRAQKLLSFPRVDVVLYHIGTNDPSSTTYDTNLGKMLTELTFQYPGAVIVVCGPATRTDSQETINVAIRTAASTRVSALNNPRVKYTNFGALWSSGQQSTYVNADNIHPKVSGHLLMSGAVWGLFTASSNALLNYVK